MGVLEAAQVEWLPLIPWPKQRKRRSRPMLGPLISPIGQSDSRPNWLSQDGYGCILALALALSLILVLALASPLVLILILALALGPSNASGENV